MYPLLVPQVKHFDEEGLYLARVDLHEELGNMYACCCVFHLDVTVVEAVQL